MSKWIMLGLAAAVALGGCGNKQPEMIGPNVPEPVAVEPIQSGPPAELAQPRDWPPLPPPPPVGGNRGGTITPPPAPTDRVHTVQAGETLWKISGMYYDRSSRANVQKILSANPSIANENDIKIGQKIVVPD